MHREVAPAANTGEGLPQALAKSQTGLATETVRVIDVAGYICVLARKIACKWCHVNGDIAIELCAIGS